MAARRGLAQGEQDPLVDGEADIPAQQVDEQELAEVQLKDLLFEAIGLAGAGQLETIVFHLILTTHLFQGILAKDGVARIINCFSTIILRPL